MNLVSPAPESAEDGGGPAAARIVNLTPHPISLHCSNGSVLSIDPEPVAARVVQEPDVPVMEVHTSAGMLPLVATQFDSAVVGLPEPVDGTIYVVSLLVIQAAPERPDLWTTNGIIRDGQGRIVGARALARPLQLHPRTLGGWAAPTTLGTARRTGEVKDAYGSETTLTLDPPMVVSHGEGQSVVERAVVICRDQEAPEFFALDAVLEDGTRVRLATEGGIAWPNVPNGFGLLGELGYVVESD